MPPRPERADRRFALLEKRLECSRRTTPALVRLEAREAGSLRENDQKRAVHQAGACRYHADPPSFPIRPAIHERTRDTFAHWRWPILAAQLGFPECSRPACRRRRGKLHGQVLRVRPPEL